MVVDEATPQAPVRAETQKRLDILKSIKQITDEEAKQFHVKFVRPDENENIPSHLQADFAGTDIKVPEDSENEIFITNGPINGVEEVERAEAAECEDILIKPAMTELTEDHLEATNAEAMVMCPITEENERPSEYDGILLGQQGAGSRTQEEEGAGIRVFREELQITIKVSEKQENGETLNSITLKGTDDKLDNAVEMLDDRKTEEPTTKESESRYLKTIGIGGEHINRVRDEFDVNIQMPDMSKGDSEIINVTGFQENVANAAKAVEAIDPVPETQVAAKPITPAAPIVHVSPVALSPVVASVAPALPPIPAAPLVIPQQVQQDAITNPGGQKRGRSTTRKIVEKGTTIVKGTKTKVVKGTKKVFRSISRGCSPIKSCSPKKKRPEPTTWWLQEMSRKCYSSGLIFRCNSRPFFRLFSAYFDVSRRFSTFSERSGLNDFTCQIPPLSTIPIQKLALIILTRSVVHPGQTTSWHQHRLASSVRPLV